MQVKLYSSFIFYRLQTGFRQLSPNVQMSAKQEFEDLISVQHERSFIRTYMTTGICSNSDIMIWRMFPGIMKMQEMSSHVLKTGIGKWLDPVLSYLGVLSFDASDEKAAEREADIKFGRYPYMMIHPLEKNNAWHFLPTEEKEKLIKERKEVLSKYGNIHETLFSSYGLDSQDYIVQREAESATILEEATKELRTLKNKEYTLSDSPVFFCIGRSLAEILDFIA